MMRAGLAALAFGLLAACSPPQETTTTAENAGASAPVAADTACTAEASQDWSAVGSNYYLIEAEASGPSCGEANATMRIKSRAGAVLFEKTYRVADVPLAFRPNGDQSGLRGEIEAWIQNTAEVPTADTLPAWPSGAERPPNFRPAVARNRYEAARGAQGPLFCFPDGGESNACVAMDGDSATLLGSWTPESP
jgi:hypothetical protein